MEKIMRLNKYIAQAGLASRRKADELIANGNVKVNGLTMKTLGYDVVDGDVVDVNGHIIEPVKKKIYVVLNKPMGFITSVSDEKGRPTVTDLVGDIDARLFPVGRLDYNTTGLLIMTNDGDAAYRLMHPAHEVTKTYRARVSGIMTKEKLSKLRRGVDIGGFITSRARVDVIKQGERSAIVEIEIHEGKNRQVRKMFNAVGSRVNSLERIAIGKIRLGHLKPGHYRKLTREEIEYIQNC